MKKDLIKESNDEVLRKMKSGESLARVPQSATWFPPRPKIVKDFKALKEIFKENDD